LEGGRPPKEFSGGSAMTLEELAGRAAVCTECDLSLSRTRVVFGAGDPGAKVMLVGEAPGFNEDRQGLPFVGAAGQLLTKLLATAGLNRSQVYITNVVKCRPPENRDPTAVEVETCNLYLKGQIELVRPHVVCALGNFATQSLLGKKIGISKVRGKAAQVGDYFVLPMFHPAAALHRGDLMPEVEADFVSLKAFLESGAKPRPVGEQTSLF
jgi:uracil-DNA glycosylase family 4